jgi:uncharacterized protein YndB with AHSA1/START domain
MKTAPGFAERELHAETVVDAPPDRVWTLLSDVRQMSDWSPELVRMIPLKRGGLRVGQWYLGINRRKGILWPTRSVVAVVDPVRQLAWDVPTNGARWIWELRPEGEGTRVVHRRPVPKKLTAVSNAFARVFLGGQGGHADELEAGMAQTVARLKAAAEG